MGHFHAYIFWENIIFFNMDAIKKHCTVSMTSRLYVDSRHKMQKLWLYQLTYLGILDKIGPKVAQNKTCFFGETEQCLIIFRKDMKIGTDLIYPSLTHSRP